MSTFYESAQAACAKRGTTLTTVLKALGKSSGATGAWKAGKSPHLDTVIAIADHLGMSLDELVYGEPDTTSKTEQREWLDILCSVPDDQRAALLTLARSMCPSRHESESEYVS
jgi:transcriptional regulator with XRE-family HTH domain